MSAPRHANLKEPDLQWSVSGAFLLTRFWFHAVQCPWWTKVERKNPRGADLLPVSRLLSANAVGFRSCTQAYARCEEYTQEGGSVAAGRARSSLSLAGRSMTPQTAGPICTQIIREEASLLGLSLSLTGRFSNSSRRFMWIRFSRLLIMTAHVRDAPGKGRTRRTMRGSS